MPQSMDPADSSTFPTFDGYARRLLRNAETETLDSYQDNLSWYREQRFSYIPIPTADKYYNLETETLEDLSPDQYVDSDLSIRKLFSLLSDHPFLLQDKMANLEVYYVDDDEYYFLEEDAPADATVLDADEIYENYPEIEDDLSNYRYRFVDRADLNRREVREALYPILADLESELAEVIKDDVPNPVDLYPNASDRVVGRREKDILEDIDLHTAEYLGLGGMIGIIKGRGHLWDEFGFDSANEVEDRLGSIQELRNRVMHSNRTLIRNAEDIEKTVERVNDAQRIIAQARGIPMENVRTLYWEE